MKYHVRVHCTSRSLKPVELFSKSKARGPVAYPRMSREFIDWIRDNNIGLVTTSGWQKEQIPDSKDIDLFVTWCFMTPSDALLFKLTF